jgi:epoxyqueuosine reductase QueG
VCPHNQPTERTRDAPVGEWYAPQRTDLDLLEVLDWTEDDRRAAFTRSAMKRARLAMMKRNAIIAAGNALARADHPPLRARLTALATDDTEDELVRATAAMVTSALGGKP